MAVDITTEIFHSGGWEDISADVRNRDPVRITRGIRNEGGRADPGALTLTLNNGRSRVNPAILGRYSPHNPRSDLFGKIGLYTPIRVTASGSVRAHMEVVKWPQAWDPSGTDVWVPLEAAGVLRRLGNRVDITRSPLRRFIAGEFTVLAYWPCEDGRDATRLARVPTGDPSSVTAGHQRVQGEMDLAEYEGFTGSLSLPTLGGTGETTGGEVPFHRFGGDQFVGLFAIPPDGLVNGANMVFLNTTGSTFSRLQLVYGTGGTLDAQIRDPDGTLLDSSAPRSLGLNGTQFLLGVDVAQSGTQISVAVFVAKLPYGGGGGRTMPTEDGFGVLFSSQTFGRISRVRIGTGAGLAGGASAAGLTFGHLLVSVSDFSTIADGVITGFDGEPATDRFLRLCQEEGILASVQLPSPAGVSEPLGPQRPGGLLDLLHDCADAEHGWMFETRESTGLVLRPRRTLYHAAADVSLSYSAAQVSPPFTPHFDDQRTVNDVTVARPEGSAARAVLRDGPLSTREPPDGIGANHDVTAERNLAHDDRLVDHASILLHEGTWDEPRYPSVTADARRLVELLGENALADAVLTLDTGMRLDVTDLPAWLPGDDARMIAQGYQEDISREQHIITFNTVPLGPTHQVGMYGEPGTAPEPDAPQRYSPVDAWTQATFDAGTDTELAVEDRTGGDQPLSQTADFPLDIAVAGSRLRVTAVGASALVDPGAPTLRSSSSVASGTTGEFSVDAPAGLVAGDLLLLFHSADIGRLSDLTVTGGLQWQLLAQAPGGAGGMRVWWKIAGSGEPASYTLGQAPTADAVAAVAAVAGARPVAPLVAAAAVTGSSTSVPTPSTNPPGSSLELRWASAKSDVTFTPPSGLTEQADENSGGNIAGSLATRDVASGGSTGVRNFIASASASNRMGATVSVSNAAWTQLLTVDQAPVNGVIPPAPIAAGSRVELWTPARYGL